MMLEQGERNETVSIYRQPDPSNIEVSRRVSEARVVRHASV